MENNERYGFLGGKDSIEALRHGGYKNIGSALSELIDNSIQAKADKISVILTVVDEIVIRKVPKIEMIATIDNGEGMDINHLRNALRLGEGTHHNDSGGHGKMGKFGVGLPQSSISQAKRVDVWSWQNGINSSKHAYIDLDDEEWISNACIDVPDDKKIPSKYVQFIGGYQSGTIVEWSSMDKKRPKAATLFRDVENQIGRTYRYWLHNNKVSIEMKSINKEGKIDSENQYVFRPVDPLFLMDDGKITDQKGYKADVTLPLFEKYGSDGEEKIEF